MWWGNMRSPITMCLSCKHVLTSVLGLSVFQQTCCALYNVKNRSCKDIILLNICNFADINANIHLFENESEQNLKVPAICYNPICRLTLLCYHRGFGFMLKMSCSDLRYAHIIWYSHKYSAVRTQELFFISQVQVQVLWMNLQFRLTLGQSLHKLRLVASDPDVTPAQKAHGSMPSQQQTRTWRSSRPT